MHSTKSAKRKRLAKAILSIFVLSLLLNHAVFSQVFPLKISENGNYITTHKGIPFLLNGTTIEIPSETIDISALVNRLYYAGFNTLFCELNLGDIQQTDNRKIKIRLRHLKFIISDASFQNMVVLVYLPSPKDSANKELQNRTIHKLKRFRNIILVRDYNPDTSIFANPRQLQGIIRKDPDSKSESYIQIANHTEYNRVNYPKILLSQKGIPYSDSAAFQIRKNAYKGILSGASGFITETDFLNHQRGNQSFALASQLKELKINLEQLPWQTFTTSTKLIPENYSKKPIISAVVPDSSMAAIYIPVFTTFSIDLTIFSSPVSLEWINPLTGSKFSQTMEASNNTELFFPPVTEPSSDWFLIIRKK